MTKRATVTWLRDLTFDAEAGGHHVMMDASPGFGNDRGPTPMRLLLTALAGCTAMDVVSILKKARQPFTGLVVHADGEQAGEHPKRFTRITVTFEVHGTGLDRRVVERAVRLSEDRYCSVSAGLREPTVVESRIEYVADEAGADPDPN
jgi:putative redox protein